MGRILFNFLLPPYEAAGGTSPQLPGPDKCGIDPKRLPWHHDVQYE